MRLLIALLFSTALGTHASSAAEITYEGAKQIKEKILSYLPEGFASSGLIEVRPGTSAYDLTVNPAVLLKDIDPKTITVSGLKPLLSALRPLDDGTWQFSQSDSLDVKGSITASEQTSDFSYKIDAFRFDGVYDPQILYFRSAEMTADGMAMTSKSGPQSLDARFGSLKSTMDSRQEPQGKVTLHSNALVKSFAETVIDPSGLQVDFSADSLSMDVSLNGLAFKPLQDMVLFVMDKVKEETETVSAEDKARLTQMIRASLPVFDGLAETIDFTNLDIATPAGKFGAQTVRYSINSTGLSDGAKAGFGIAFDKPSIPPGLIPDAYEVAVPESFAMNISVDKLNLASGINYFLDHADFDAAAPLDDQQTAEIERIFLPGGAVTVRYDEVRARSSIYDVSLSGTTTFYPEETARQNTEVTVFARDLDKTIAYLQQNAQTVPDFNQAAFFVLMAKGFAKQMPDGSNMWAVSVDETNKVKINGQDLPF
ncbi:hypothetical protein EPK99_08525 [Neorhizobium lilium]|uniref:DUF945 domain-containing protein n=1 Tax=Neorhizobium lilium TaxID=2503024 RepID=A0A3S3RUR9_9HYPH|nr:hypothetical protein [Neorhizobium lilium]RWX78633.1 hypothetical protein EPK99_08525 [Neorhizobium lilium]